MRLLSILGGSIHEGLTVVRTTPEHHLDVPVRRQVYMALIPAMDNRLPFGGVGHHRRTTLDLHIVR
jgi:hypothetical protein